MKGMSVDSADLHWYGLDGDRRFAFIRSDNASDFPWLTGRQIPEIVTWQPEFTDPSNRRTSSVNVTLPSGITLAVESEDLLEHVGSLHNGPVHRMQLNRGMFDAAPISIVSLTTVEHLSAVYGSPLDYRRFRINIIIDPIQKTPYVEDSWIGGSLTFGEGANSATITPVRPIKRCAMVNIEPDTAETDASVLKNVVKSRDNCIGVYASPRTIGKVCVGDQLFINRGVE